MIKNKIKVIYEKEEFVEIGNEQVTDEKSIRAQKDDIEFEECEEVACRPKSLSFLQDNEAYSMASKNSVSGLKEIEEDLKIAVGYKILIPITMIPNNEIDLWQILDLIKIMLQGDLWEFDLDEKFLVADCSTSQSSTVGENYSLCLHKNKIEEKVKSAMTEIGIDEFATLIQTERSYKNNFVNESYR